MRLLYVEVELGSPVLGDAVEGDIDVLRVDAFGGPLSDAEPRGVFGDGIAADFVATTAVEPRRLLAVVSGEPAAKPEQAPAMLVQLVGPVDGEFANGLPPYRTQVDSSY